MKDEDRYLADLGIKGVILRSLELFRPNFPLICQIAFVSYLPMIAFAVICKVFFPELLETALDTQQEAFSMVKTYLPPYILLFILTSPPVNVAAVTIVSDTYAGLVISFQRVFQLMKRHSILIFMTSVVHLLMVIPAFLCLVLPGIFLMVVWCVYDAAIVIEGKGLMESLARSWDLTSGFRIEVFSTLVIVVIVIVGLTDIWTLVMAQLSSGYIYFHLIVGCIPYCIFLPFVRILEAVIYFNLRVRKESLNQTQLLNELGEDVRQRMEADTMANQAGSFL